MSDVPTAETRQALGDAIRASCRPLGFRYYGRHRAIIYQDGTAQVATTRDWLSNEGTHEPTPFEYLQLGFEMPACSPDTDFGWMAEQVTRKVKKLKELITENSAAKTAVTAVVTVAEQTK